MAILKHEAAVKDAIVRGDRNRPGAYDISLWSNLGGWAPLQGGAPFHSKKEHE